MRRACRNTTTGTPQPQPRPTLRRQCRDFCQIEWELHRMKSKLDKKKTRYVEWWYYTVLIVSGVV